MGTKRSSIRHRARRQAIVAELLERDGDRCWYCGCPFGEGGRVLTLDHLDPLAHGGRSKLENLRLCCRTCNRRKGAMGADAYFASKLLAVRRRQVEAEEAELPKRAFSHLELQWSGPWRWQCDSCGKTGSDPASSPAAVPCMEESSETP